MSKFFVSHSSKDEVLIKSFVDRILKLGLKIPNEDIFCTSIENSGIKSGEDFKSVIRERLKQAKVVIQVITSNYKNSEVCLNEMGAAWVLSEKVIPFILEPIKYENVGFVHSTTQILKINSKADLLKFRDDNVELFLTDKFQAVNYDGQISEFLKIFIDGTNVIKTHSLVEGVSEQDIQTYFHRYLEPDIDRIGLVLKAQPTLSDCREIFTDSYFKEVHSFYSMLYKSLLGNAEDFRSIVNKSGVKTKLVTYRDIHEKANSIQIKSQFPFSLNSGIKLFHVKFTEYNEDIGYTLNYWAYLNNRWVFFPKPYRVIDNIYDMKQDKALKFLIKAFKFFGLNKDLKKYKGRHEVAVNHVVEELLKP